MCVVLRCSCVLFRDGGLCKLTLSACRKFVVGAFMHSEKYAGDDPLLICWRIVNNPTQTWLSTLRASVPEWPWHFLNFLPEPQGQGSLRPTFGAARFTGAGLI